MGLTVGAIILAVAALLSGTTRMAFLALGLTLPGLMLQDSWRYSFFALGRGGQAFLNDTVWAVALIPALVLLRETGHANVFWFVFAWGAQPRRRRRNRALCRPAPCPGCPERGNGCRVIAISGRVTCGGNSPTARRASCAITASASSWAWRRSATCRPPTR